MQTLPVAGDRPNRPINSPSTTHLAWPLSAHKLPRRRGVRTTAASHVVTEHLRVPIEQALGFIQTRAGPPTARVTGRRPSVEAVGDLTGGSHTKEHRKSAEVAQIHAATGV